MTGDDALSEVTPLIDLGVDSLVAVEIRTWFAQEVGVDVAVLKILGGPSVEELVDDVVQKLCANAEASKSETESSDGTSPVSEEVDKTETSRTSVDLDAEEMMDKKEE